MSANSADSSFFPTFFGAAAAVFPRRTRGEDWGEKSDGGTLLLSLRKGEGRAGKGEKRWEEERVAFQRKIRIQRCVTYFSKVFCSDVKETETRYVQGK